MQGYWQRPALTGRAIDVDGWLHTGLLCTADPDGDFFITGHIRDIVVQDGSVPAVEHLVPIAWIVGTTHHSVTLDCTQSALAAIEPFAEERYISSNASDYEPFYAVDPFAEFEAGHIPLVTEHIPPGELAIQRDTQVMASDGPAGHVTAFVVDRASGGIRSIMLQLGHWLTKHEQAIRIGEVERIGSRALYLTLARDQIATLLPRD